MDQLFYIFKKGFLFRLIFCVNICLVAQTAFTQVSLSGQITDKNGTPLDGVVIKNWHKNMTNNYYKVLFLIEKKELFIR